MSRADFHKYLDRLDKSTKLSMHVLGYLSFEFFKGPNRVVHSDNFDGDLYFNIHE